MLIYTVFMNLAYSPHTLLNFLRLRLYKHSEIMDIVNYVGNCKFKSIFRLLLKLNMRIELKNYDDLKKYSWSKLWIAPDSLHGPRPWSLVVVLDSWQELSQWVPFYFIGWNDAQNNDQHFWIAIKVWFSRNAKKGSR